MTTHAVTLTILDQEDEPVSGLVIELRHQNTLFLVGTLVTDDDGVVTFPAVENNRYIVSASTQGVRLPGTLIVVEGAAELEFSLVATSNGIVTPTPTPTCTVFGFLEVPKGEVAGVSITVIRQVGVSGGGTGVNPRHRNVSSYSVRVPVENGRWEVDVPQGATCIVSILSIGFTKNFIVPSVSSVGIADLHSVLPSTPFNSSSSLS